MRSGFLSCIAAVAVLTACGADGEATGGASAAIAVPNAAGCSDASQWRQRAAEARSEALESSSDQARINFVNRANFLASMAVAADLQCIVNLNDSDQALEAALDAARSAESTRSFYEQTIRWGEAHHAANGAIELLVQRLPRQDLE
ncbi:hypothetical protein BH23GEM9_BH23GEM9_29480 [soil metagenome]